MAAVDLDASADLFRRLVDAPLFEHLGDPIQDSNVETVRTWTAAKAAEAKMTWSNAYTRGKNYLAAKLIAELGMDWFQKNYNATAEAVDKQMPRSLKLRVGKLAREGNCPDYFRQRVLGDFGKGAIEYAARGIFDQGFFRAYLEKWYFAGHLPCGWKGRLPPEPRDYALFPLAQILGEGRLIVF